MNISIPEHFCRTRNTLTGCLLFGDDVSATDDGTSSANAIGSPSRTLSTSANSTNADPHSTELSPNWPRRGTATRALSSWNRTFIRMHCAKRCLQPSRQQDPMANQTQLGQSDWESESLFSSLLPTLVSAHARRTCESKTRASHIASSSFCVCKWSGCR